MIVCMSGTTRYRSVVAPVQEIGDRMSQGWANDRDQDRHTHSLA